MLALVLALVAGYANGSVPPTDGLGIRITNVVFDAVGVDVDFVTTNPPPYVAAVFRAEDAGFSSRIRPVRARLVSEKHACLAGDFARYENAFVQVFMPSITNDPMFRVITVEERESAYDFLRKRIDRDCVGEDSSDLWTDKGMSENMVIFDDHTWGSFTVSTDRFVTVQIQGRRAVPAAPSQACAYNQVLVCDNIYSPTNVWAVYDEGSTNIKNAHLTYLTAGWEGCHVGDRVRVSEWDTRAGNSWYYEREVCLYFNPHYRTSDWHSRDVVFEEHGFEPRRFGPFDTSVGCGLRILVDDEQMLYRAERAYSLFSDRSNECVLQRPFKALSSWNGRKIKLDWMGFVNLVHETNAIPGRIYMEGL